MKEVRQQAVNGSPPGPSAASAAWPWSAGADRLLPVRGWWLLAVLVLVSAATRWLSLVIDVLDIDETAHIVGSWTLMHGGLLYRDFVDNKPPLLYAAYAVAQLFGTSLTGVHAFTAIVVVPTTAVAIAAFFRFTRAGALAAIVFVVFSAAFLAHDMLSTNAEVLMQWPAAWALALVRDEDEAVHPGRAFAAGVLLGVGFLIKYHVATWGIAVVAALAMAARARHVWRPHVRAAAFLVAGASLPSGLVLAWFAAHGAAGSLVYWTILNNFHYTENPIAPGEALQRAAFLASFVAVTAPLWWAVWKARDAHASIYRGALVPFLVAASIPPVVLGWRFFPHYFIQLYVPLAIAAGAWLDGEPGRDRRRVRWLFRYALALTIVTQAVNAWLYLGPTRVYRERDPVYRAAAAALVNGGCGPGASVFVWGYAPVIYYYSRLPPASRFAVLAQARLTSYVPGNLTAVRSRSGGEATYAVPEHWDWLMADLERSHVSYVVDTAPAGLYRWNHYPMQRFPRLAGYLARGFDRIADVGGVVIYRRQGCTGIDRAKFGRSGDTQHGPDHR